MRIITTLLGSLVIGFSGCRPESTGQYQTTSLNLQVSAEVIISGYNGNIMEPFLSRDGKILLFNNLNSLPENTNLHWATRVNDSLFTYEGEIEGVNTADLEGVPSLDLAGNLYFISTRNYSTTLSTIYHGAFSLGKASNVQLVEGVSRLEPGIVNFDAEVSADGQTLYFADGLYSASAELKSADLVYAQKTLSVFKRAANSQEIFQHINTDDLEYAPAISADQLTLFFTRIRLPLTASSIPECWVSTRPNTHSPFRHPAKLTDISGFVEAITIAPDQRTLYYHRKMGDRFRLYRTRILP